MGAAAQAVDIGSGQGMGGKYLTFALGAEEYGIIITKVREIIGIMEITAVPHTPDFIKGVINLRGRVIPIVELRVKFGMELKPYDDRTCIIVVDVVGPSGMVQVGMLVDSVSEVVNMAAQDIESPPDFGAAAHADNIVGLGKIKGKLKILLDVDKVIGHSLAATLTEIA